MAKRSLLTLVRVVGALALVFILYAWIHPDYLRKWSSQRAVASAETRASASEVAAKTADKADGPPQAQTSAAAASTASSGVPPVSTATAAAAPAAASAAASSAAKDAASAAAIASAIAEAIEPPAAILPAIAIVPPSPKPTASQAAVARWIGTKYGVAPGAIAPLVVEADILTKSYHLSPDLLIAVMAIESNFHPYIQSEAGAQGLMQVMPKIHSKRYAKFGGKTAFLDPIVSLRVGAEILRDCIKFKNGSEAEGLRFYFGGGPASDTYIGKVRAEQQRLNAVSRGAHVAPTD